MPLYTADALVLRTYKLGEADRIVVFLTRDRGKKRGVAQSARRPRSRFVGALEPPTSSRNSSAPSLTAVSGVFSSCETWRRNRVCCSSSSWSLVRSHSSR